MKCANCKCDIIGETYLKCLDNFLLVKYFDEEQNNVFCSKDCFCEALTLEEIEIEDEETD